MKGSPESQRAVARAPGWVEMSSLSSRFVSGTEFESYEDFNESLKIIVPKRFNFAFDVVDVYAKEDPEKVALVWCNDLGDDLILSFGELKLKSDQAANLFLTNTPQLAAGMRG